MQIDGASGTQNDLLKQKLHNHFRTLTHKGLYSGAVLINWSGEVLLKDGYGIADNDKGKPNRSSTAYGIASMSKAFTAVSIMMLEERGLLSVNDKLTDYLPDYPNGDNISIHQLLNMTAGVPDFFGNALSSGNMSKFHTPEELLQYFINDPPDHAPGTEWTYCNSCYILLGIILEQVSGMTYKEFIETEIMAPLDMRRSSYPMLDRLDDSTVLEKAFPYKKAVTYENAGIIPPEPADFLNPTVAFSAGGVFSTVMDMYKWHRALSTDQLVSPQTLERIFTPGLGNYGYGWYIESLEIAGREHKLIWHWGSYIGYHSFIARFVDDETVIILLLNFTALEIENQNELFPIVKGAASIIFEND
ncbi:MAG: beta-lactamase family protein [bacterium]|nr:beta-lactamase family protein [bacterium]